MKIYADNVSLKNKSGFVIPSVEFFNKNKLLRHCGNGYIFKFAGIKFDV